VTRTEDREGKALASAAVKADASADALMTASLRRKSVIVVDELPK